MSRVRISRVDGGTFGRMSGRTVEFPDHDFIVVSGPNESGKSTLAELISWVLAGRRSDHEVGLRFAPTSVDGTRPIDIAATIDGFVAGVPFSVERSFRIRRANRGRQPMEPQPVITVGGSATETTTWAAHIGVETGDDYFRRYRITGPYDSDNSIDIQQLLEALAAGATAQIPPRAVLEALAAHADLLVPGPSGRIAGDRAIRPPTEALDAAKAARRQIDADQQQIESLRRALDDVESMLPTLTADRIQIAAEHDAHVRASELLPVRGQLADALRELDELESIDPAWDTVLAAPGEFDMAVARLAGAASVVAEAGRALDTARISAGLDTHEVAALTVTSADVAEVADLHRARTAATGQLDRARDRTPEITRILDEGAAELAAKATALGTTTAHLRGFASMAVDDASFGDPIRHWSDAEASLGVLGPTVAAARAESERTRRDLDDAEARWRQAGDERSPTAVVAGLDVTSATRSTGPSVTVFAVVLIAVAASSLLSPWAALGAAVVSAGVLIVSRSRRARGSVIEPTATPAEVVALAEAVIAARDRHVAAEGAVRQATADLDRATATSAGAEERATRLLADLGFTGVGDVARAMRIRAERTAVVDLVERVTGAEAERVALDRSVSNAREEIAAVDAALEAIAARCNVPRVGRTLDDRLIEQLQRAHLARAAHEAAVDQHAAAFSRLSALTPGLVLPDDAELVRTEFGRVSALAALRSSARARRDDARRQLDTAGPRVIELLEDPEMGEGVLAVKIDDLEHRLAELAEVIESSVEQRGSLGHQLRELSDRTDLAAVTHAIRQAESEQRRHAIEGAAWWLAHRLVADVKDEVEAHQQPELVRRAGRLTERISHGYWHGLSTDDTGGILVRQGDGHVHQHGLSAGARDILRLAVRLAVAETHSAKVGVALPLILDDPTASVDSERAPRLFEVLSELSASHQVILMTHDEATVSRAVAVGAVEVAIGRP